MVGVDFDDRDRASLVGDVGQRPPFRRTEATIRRQDGQIIRPIAAIGRSGASISIDRRLERVGICGVVPRFRSIDRFVELTFLKKRQN